MQRHNSGSHPRLSRRGVVRALGASAAALTLGGSLSHVAAQTSTPESSSVAESLMYTLVERRTVNPVSMEETIERGQREFFPLLLAAPGVVSFSLARHRCAECHEHGDHRLGEPGAG